MSFTTQGFINKIEFSYFKTYEEYLELKRFLEKNEYDYIITNKELLNPTSELVYNSKGATDFNRNLANILHTPYTDHDAWMCWPVYREAILFYNERDALIDGLNIGFQCSFVLNLKNESILTDRKVFKKLLTLLINLGHKI